MNGELTAEQRARDVLNNLYSKPYPGSHAYTHAADAIAAAILAAEQAARETALREAEAVLRARAEGHAVSSKDPAKQFLTNWSRLVKETNACADAIATLARSAAEAQPAGEGPAGSKL